MTLRTLARQSLQLDAALLAEQDLPLGMRSRFVATKYAALAGLLVGRRMSVPVGDARVRVEDMSGIGTIHSTLLDVRDEVIRASVLPRRPPIIVDVGANIGQFCLAIKLFRPDSIIHSIEADPLTFRRLVANTTLLRGVTTYNAAAGASERTMPFYRHRFSGMSTFRPSPGEHYEGLAQLPMRTLDTLIGASVEVVDLLKIDVEGLELEVLRGARELLSRCAAVLVEVRLGADQTGQPNALDVLASLRDVAPTAKVRTVGRVLAGASGPACVDVLIDLQPV